MVSRHIRALPILIVLHTSGYVRSSIAMSLFSSRLASNYNPHRSPAASFGIPNASTSYDQHRCPRQSSASSAIYNVAADGP